MNPVTKPDELPFPTYEFVHLHAPTDQFITEWRGTGQPLWRILNGNAKEALDLIDDDSIDCVVTSPPYFWLRDYKVKGQIGLEDSVEGYVASMKEVMERVRLKLK